LDLIQTLNTINDNFSLYFLINRKKYQPMKTSKKFNNFLIETGLTMISSHTFHLVIISYKYYFLLLTFITTYLFIY